MTATNPSILQKMSLRAKILLPFFLILLALGTVATVGSIVLIRQELLRTIDERLAAYQEIVFREIKKQELLLSTYARLLEYQQAAGAAETAESTILQDEIYGELAKAKISVTLYPFQLTEQLPSPSLRNLFEQAATSGKPRFRFTTDLGPTATLTVAVPLMHGGRTRDIMLLQTPMDRVFLKKLGAPFQAETFLLSTEGHVLAASDPEGKVPQLTPEELAQVMTGQPFFKTYAWSSGRRHLIGAVPLGTTDMVLLAIEIPTTHLARIVNTLTTRAGLSILLALLLGCYIYYALIRQITAPLKELRQATSAVSEGNLLYRIPTDGQGEFGHLAQSFNTMLTELYSLYQHKIESEKDLTQAQEQIRFKNILEQKNQEIERTNRELKTHLREISALFQLNQAMISTLDLNVLFDRTLALLKDLLLCKDMVLLLYNAGAEELEVRKTVGIDLELLKGIGFTLNEGVTGLAARSQKLQYVRDVLQEPDYMNYKGKLPAIGSMISAPITVKNRLVGALNLHKDRPGAFTDSELKLIQAATNQLAIAIENAQLYEKTRTLSNTDELTNLANRRYFQEILKRELAQAGRFHSSFTLIMIDIDHFKQFNDTYGHLSGDVALRRVATLLLQNTRGIDLVARFGGEEFIILLPKTTKEGARAAAEKLRQCIGAEIFPVTGPEENAARLTLSLGVAEYPTDSKDTYELLDLADRALYLAKESGRNRTVVWSAQNTTLAFPTPKNQTIPSE